MITDLMTLISSLSKETSNSYNDIMNMPGHILLGIYNTLTKIFEEEKKRQDEESGKYKQSLPSGVGSFDPRSYLSGVNIPGL